MSSPRSVTVEMGGRTIVGTLSVANQVIVVSYGSATTTTVYHGVRPQHIAKRLLRQLAMTARRETVAQAI